LYDKDDLYQKSVRQYHSSIGLAGAAVAIWIADFIWTLAGTTDLGKITWFSEPHGLSIDSYVDPATMTPLVCVSYSF
jgi:hypothetical protein